MMPIAFIFFAFNVAYAYVEAAGDAHIDNRNKK
jgi:hypothetical protein